MNRRNNYILNNIKKSKTISQKYPKEDYNNNNRRNKIPLYKIFMEENNTKAKKKFHLMKFAKEFQNIKDNHNHHNHYQMKLQYQI